MLFSSQKLLRSWLTRIGSLGPALGLGMVMMLWGSSALAAITWSTNPAQTSPVVVTEGGVLAFAVTATSNNTAAIVILDIDAGAPAGVSFTPAEGTGSASSNFSWNTAGAAGTYKLVFVADDSLGGGPYQLSIDVIVNDTPVANNDSGALVTVLEGGAFNIDVVANDIDNIGGIDDATVIPSTPAHGTAVNKATGAGNYLIEYRNNGDETTSDTFTYVVSDTYGAGSNTATVTVTVIPQNDAPVILNPGTQNDNEGDAVDFTIGATDAENNKLTFSALNLPQGLSINSSGRITGTIGLDAAPGGVVTIRVTDDGKDSPGPQTSEITFQWNIGNKNQAPVFDPIGNKSGSENTLLTFNVRAVDPDGTIPALSASGLPAGATFVDNNNGTGTFSWTPSYTQGNSNPTVYNGVTFSATDSVSASVNVSISISIANANRAPLALADTFSVPKRGVASSPGDFPLTVLSNDSDPDQAEGDTLSLVAVTVQPSHGVAVVSGSNILYTAATGYTGADSLTYQISDAGNGTGVKKTATATVTLNVVNQPPQLQNPIPNFNTNEDAPFSYQVPANTFTDPNQDPLTYTAQPVLDSGGSDFRNWLVFNASTRTFAGTPKYTDAGKYYKIEVGATDNTGAKASVIFTITVNAINDAPIITGGPANQTHAEGTTVAIPGPTATDEEDGTPTEFVLTILPGLPAGITFNKSTGALSGTLGYTSAGTYDVSIVALDSGGLKSNAWTYQWVVSNTNRAPKFGVINTSRTAYENSLLTFDVVATDPDGNAMTITMANAPAGATLSATVNGTTGASATFSWTPKFTDGDSDPSVYLGLKFTVTDNDSKPLSTVSDAVSISVFNVNQPPKVTNPGTQNSAENDVISLKIVASDPDGAVALTFSAQGLPPGLSISPSSGLISGTLSYEASARSPYSVLVTVSDGQDVSNISFPWNVANTNRPPVVDPIGNKQVKEGETLTFPVTATDADGDTVTITMKHNITGTPAFRPTLTPNGNGGYTFNWTTSFDQEGIYQVTFTANDGTDNSADRIISIEVGGTNRAPQITPITDQTVAEGQVKQLAVSASDPDIGDTLKFSVIGPSFVSIIDKGDGTATLVIAPGYTDAGPAVNITVVVADSATPSAEDLEVFALTVTETNRKPVISAIGDINVGRGVPADPIQITVSDPDANSELTVTTDGFTPWVNLMTQQLGTYYQLNIAPDADVVEGQYGPMTITVTDNGSPAQSASITFHINVNPYSRKWLGQVSTDWQNTENWEPAGLPRDIDNVYIPLTGMQPVIGIDSNVTINDLTVDAGVAVDIGSNQLGIKGNLHAADAFTDTGVIVMTGNGVTLQGIVPNLLIEGTVTSVGDVTVNANLDLQGDGSFDVGANNVQVSGNLGLVGTSRLVMQDPAGQMTVSGDAFFNGGSTSGLLTEGVLHIGGNFTQSNDANASDLSFRADGNHRVVLDGSVVQSVMFSSPGRTASRFQNLDVLNTAGVIFQSNMRIEASLLNTGLVSILGSPNPVVSVRGSGFLNEVGGIVTGAGTIDVSGASFANNGIIKSGSSAGILEVTGPLILSADSELHIELGGTNPGSGYDQIRATDVTVNGILDVTLLNGYSPFPGDEYQVLVGTNSLNGGFHTQNLPTLDPAFDWVVDEGGNNQVTLRVKYTNPSTVVNSADDVDDGKCNSDHCSLREAIREANVTDGTDLIIFSIAGFGPHTISLQSPLPEITDWVFIDATTQAGIFTGNTRPIELDGSGAGSANGFVIRSGNTRIRGFAINGFNGNGIVISNSGNNTIEGNFIGTDVSGTGIIANTGNGIIIDNAANNMIGINNVISGNNGNGITVRGAQATGNIIIGNKIGSDADGSADLGNQAAGIRIDTAGNVKIGDTNPVLANTIAFNNGDGITIINSQGNKVLVNSIHDNADLGIDLANDDVTANDPLDEDAGANGLQNYPHIDAATAGLNKITGVLNSAPETAYSLYFYMNETCDASGYGEGSVYVGVKDVITDGEGNASFDLTTSLALPAGSSITATALGVNGSSEFSACTVVDLSPPDMAIAKQSQGTFIVGANGKYLITVSNVGKGQNTGPIVVTDVLPAGLGYVAAGNADWSCNASGQTVTCSSELHLEPGQESAFTLDVAVYGDAVPSVTNTATVSTAQDYNVANDMVTVETLVSTFGSGFIPVITPDNIPVAKKGLPYSVTFGVNGGLPPYDIEIVANVPGLTVIGDKLEGAPEESGEFEVVVNARDNNVPPTEVTRTYTLIVEANNGVAVATTSLTKGVVGASYSYLLKGVGGSAPYSWVSTSALPPGLTLVSTGQLSGIPQQEGAFEFGVKLRDRNGKSARATLSLTIDALGLVNLTPALPAALKDVKYSVPMLVSGGFGPYECVVINGILPPGIEMNGCRVSGTPVEGGTYSFIVRISDSSEPALSVDASFNIKVATSTEVGLGAAPRFKSIDEGGVINVSEELGKGSPDGGYPDEDLQNMATDAYGNQYVVGYAYNGKRYVIHVIKFNANGEKVWHQLLDTGIHSYGYGIAVAPDQSVYVGGYTLQGNVYRGLVARFDHSGTQQWVKYYKEGKYQTDVFYKIVADDSGVYAVGESYNGKNFDGLMAKYSPDGDMLWKQVRNGVDNDTAYAVDLACNNGTACQLIVGGASGHNATRSGWLMKLNPDSGEVNTTYNWAGDFVVEDVAVAATGEIVIAGTAANGNWRLQKVTAAFAPLWGVEGVTYVGDDKEGLPTVRLRSVALDADGYIYAAGHRNQAGDDDVLLAVFDPDGVKTGELALDADADTTDQEAHGIIVDANQRVVVSGQAVSGSGSTFLLLYVNTGKCLDSDLLGCQATTTP